jgi:hypothetical protein
MIYQEVKHLIFYVMLPTSQICENFTELHYQYSLQFCQQSSSNLVKVAVLPLQPLAYDVLQCAIIGMKVSLQNVFQRTKHVQIRWCEVQIAGWVWQHWPSKFCVGLRGVHNHEQPGVLMGEHISDFPYQKTLNKGEHKLSECFNIAVKSFLLLVPASSQQEDLSHPEGL